MQYHGLARISHQTGTLHDSVPLLHTSSACLNHRSLLGFAKQWHTLVRNAGWLGHLCPEIFGFFTGCKQQG